MCTTISPQAAERGGATTFTKSDIFVVPKRGQATFFSYKGPDGRMDDGYTEHSGCPVLEGTFCAICAFCVFLDTGGVFLNVFQYSWRIKADYNHSLLIAISLHMLC